MDWLQLEAFCSLVELGSMTRAAEAHFRTQSALSQQISRLESDLDCKLLNRIGKKGFTLTAAGAEFYKFAKESLARKTKMLERLNDVRNNSIGSLTISSVNVGLWLIHKKITRYRALFPNVNLKLLERSPQYSIELLKKGEVDIALVHCKSASAALDSYPLTSARYMLVAPISHPILKKDKAEMEDLAAYPLNVSLANNRFAGRDLLDRTMREKGLSYAIANESSNIFLNLSYTQIGFGLTFGLFYDIPGIYDFTGLGSISLENLFPAETITLLTRKGDTPAQYKKTFIDILQDSNWTC